ncbi:hypothetical protein [Acidovorax sp.]|uniref:hypothetical protein n=1 Tax=Acidovorax sp. TaxID=1872122 RepID=UPI0025C6B16C|nr:hypothetical protein [Acidovorax sp.]
MTQHRYHRTAHVTATASRMLAATTSLCLAWSAHAGRPLSVDDAGVDEVGHGHVEVWWGPARPARHGVHGPCLHPHGRTGAGRRAGA